MQGSLWPVGKLKWVDKLVAGSIRGSEIFFCLLQLILKGILLQKLQGTPEGWVRKERETIFSAASGLFGNISPNHSHWKRSRMPNIRASQRRGGPRSGVYSASIWDQNFLTFNLSFPANLATHFSPSPPSKPMRRFHAILRVSFLSQCLHHLSPRKTLLSIRYILCGCKTQFLPFKYPAQSQVRLMDTLSVLCP